MRIEIGLNFIRISHKMTWKTLGEVLGKSDQQGTRAGSFSILNFVKKVTDADTREEYEKSLRKSLIDHLTGNKLDNELFLSHFRMDDWLKTSNVEIREPNKRNKLYTWYRTPSLHDVSCVLSEKLSDEELRDKIGGITLTFRIEDEDKNRKDKLTKFVHGSATVDGQKGYKIGQTWYIVKSDFSKRVDKVFADFMKEARLDEGKKGERKLLIWKKFEKKRKGEEKTGEKQGRGTVKEKKNEKKDNKEEDLGYFCAEEFAEFAGICSDDAVNILDLLSEGSGSQAALNNIDEAGAAGDSVHSVRLCKKEKDGEKDIYKVIKTDLGVFFSKWFKDICNTKHEDVARTKHEDVARTLRMFASQEEEDFNRTHLFAKGFYVGDQIKPNNVELFDIMRHDEETNKTYLYHVKRNFDHCTRDACAQIRDSAHLLWADRLEGKHIHIDDFFRLATETESKESFRLELKDRLSKLTKEGLTKMFSDDTTLVFVYAFTTWSQEKDERIMNNKKFKKIDKEEIKKGIWRRARQQNLWDVYGEQIIRGWLSLWQIHLHEAERLCRTIQNRRNQRKN